MREAVLEEKTILGHPAGLFVLFFTEMWERFSFYGMRAILTLYMITSVADLNAGLGWTEAFALSIYGWYTMLVYVMAIPGGILADKYIGQKKSVLVGGIILCIGHSVLAVDAIWAFFAGMALIVVGVGALKPNISTMVGGLYPEGDGRRDDGFYIFYMGINLGSLLATVIVGYIGEVYGWHYGFGLAGIGMAIGTGIFLWGQKYLKGVGEPPIKDKTSEEATTSLGTLFKNLLSSPLQLGVTIVLIILSVAGAMYYADGGEQIAYMLLGIFISIVIGILMMIYIDVDKIEKDRYMVLLLSFLIVIVFWSAFEQAGGLMNIYTHQKIDRHVSSMVIDAILLIPVAVLLVLGFLALRKKKDARYVYFSVSGILAAVWGLIKYGGLPDIYEIPASMFQGVNATFIIIFATLVAAFWVWWRKKGYESSSLFKMAVGTIIMGIGFLFMAYASTQIVVYGDKAALYLLILAYMFHTLGELCASPVALSFITKLAPMKYVSILMGVYFAATGFGNKIAGGIGQAAQTEPIRVELMAEASGLIPLNNEGNPEQQFTLLGTYKETSDGSFSIVSLDDASDLKQSINFGDQALASLGARISKVQNKIDHDPTIRVEMRSKDGVYGGDLEVFEEQNNREYWTFVSIFIFTVAFGVLLMLFLKRLKRLTHGAEDVIAEDN